MSANTRKFNTAQGIVLGALVGASAWLILVSTAMWAVSA